ncbi:MAG: chorismate synthase, partial [Acidimicrobiales bacterium]
LGQAFLGIPAAKAVEIGEGFGGVLRRGSDAHDPISWDAGEGVYRRATAHAGGIEGGMSTGGLVMARVAMKPLSTLNRPVLKTVDTVTKEEVVSFKERTDVTAVPAMGVVAETEMALTLAAEALRKFGGDSLDEVVRNRDGFLAGL